MRGTVEMMGCLLASTGLSIVMFTILDVTTPAHSQQSTVPPSSLSTTPLSPSKSAQDGIASCELCRNLEGRPGSDLKLHRRHIDQDLHAHKKAKGLSSKRGFRNPLPRRKLDEGEYQRQE